ncbi:MAG: MBL fold metallo-hydrolase [bacterium]|jgi:L-ascorbate metabolism protein UlaG (beta-lactamase superfamily)
MLERIRWLGHASFLIAGEPSVYIDPWKLATTEEADIVLISHSHYDHFSAADVSEIRGETTEVVCPRDVADQLSGRVTTVAPGSRVSVRDVLIEVLPAYNVTSSFHPRGDLGLGFVLTFEGGRRLYYAGDTDFIPEMAGLKDVDVALLPVGGRYTMDAEEAARAANTFRPRVVIPYHWGDIVGTRQDAERFSQAFAGETRILEEDGRP